MHNHKSQSTSIGMSSSGISVTADTSNTHHALQKADVAGLQELAQEKQANKALLNKTVAVIGDKVYRKEVEGKKLVNMSCANTNQENCKPVETTLDKVKAVNGTINAFNNGMLSDSNDALISAYLRSTSQELKDTRVRHQTP